LYTVPPANTTSKLLPLILLFLVLSILTFLGYHIYLSVQKISAQATAKLEERHLSVSKDGARIGVKPKDTEHLVDATRDGIVKVWNLSTWPDYKSRLWNKQDPKEKENIRLRKGAGQAAM
jgi:hypothetical protein